MIDIIEELTKDIEYFNRLGFIELAKKFERDLNAIRGLMNDKENIPTAE